MEQWNNVELNDLSRKKSGSTMSDIIAEVKNNNINNNNNNNKNNNNHDNNHENEHLKDVDKNSAVLQAGSQIKPNLNLYDVESLTRRLYGITIGECKELISYDDRNFLIKEDINIKNPLITTHCLDGYVFKVLNALDSKKEEFVEAQTQILLYLANENIKCPQPIKNALGKYFSLEHLNGNDHIVRLLTYIPGKMLHEVPMNNYLLFQAGEYLAKTDLILKKFSHVAYETHQTLWMLQSVPHLRDFIYAINNSERQQLVHDIVKAFEDNVLSKLQEFEMQIIHGDFNEQNIIVESEQNGSGDVYHVTGVIDFGDTNRSPLIFEVGIAMTYMMLQAKSLKSGGIFLAGYNSVRKLSPDELTALKYCVAARFAQSLTMGAYTHSQDPSNEYVLVTQAQGWKLLEELWKVNFKTIDELWQTTGDKYLTQSDK